MSDDPARWNTRQGGAPDPLRELLGEAKNDLPPPSTLERIALRLPLAPPPATPPDPVSPAGAGASAVVKLAAGVAAIGVVAGGLWLATRSGEPTAAPASASAPSAPSTHLEDETITEMPAPSPAPSASAAVKLAEPSGAPKLSKGPTEAELLQRAQAALRTDPTRALALTREHRRRFPSGALAQEREVIAIEALSRLGRGGEAGKRAEDFGKKYPGSAHQKKVETAAGGDRR